MALNSVITNAGAMVALQSLNKTNDMMDTTQKRISTGYRVSDAKDDGAAFAVAQKVRGDLSGLTSANQQLGGVKGLIDSTLGSVSNVSTLLSSVKDVLGKLADENVDDSAREQYTSQFKSYVKQINTFVSDANYNGTRLLSSTADDPSTGAAFTGGSVAVTRNEKGQTYTVMSSATTGDDLTFTADITDSAGDLDALTSMTTDEAKAMLGDAEAIANGAAVPTNLKDFKTVEDSVNSLMNELGNDSKFVDSQVSFNKTRMDAMESGLGALIDADLAKESARMQSLTIRQQLGTTSLSTANQAPSSLLSLFR
jgi:flagellin